VKKFSLLAMVVTASLLGALAIGAASASATVLCKQAAAANNCAPEDTYPEGTEVHAELAPTTFLYITEQNGTLRNSCSASEMATTLGIQQFEYQRSAMTALSFGGCTTSPVTVERLGEPDFQWKPGTHGGHMYGYGVRIGFNYFGLACVYTFWGPGEIVPGASPKLVYSYGELVRLSGSFICPYKMSISATYDITTPTPLYVENE
jgi:hypothetical protein